MVPRGLKGLSGAERRLGSAWLLCLGLPGLAFGQMSRNEVSVAAELTYTDNARLSRDDKVSDFILEVRPRVVLERQRGRLSGRMDYAMDGVAHTRERVDSRVFNTFAGTGRLEAIENFFFVDARASVSGENVSVFAPLALSNVTGSNNRREVRSVSVSPFIQSVVGNALSYSLRMNWSMLDSDADNVARTGNTRVTGALSQAVPGARWSWALTVDSSVNHYRDRDDLYNEVARARLQYSPVPSATVFGTVGRERYNYVQGESSRGMSGAGVSWSPGARTSMSFERESRFFGTYRAARVAHRTPLAAMSLEYSRDLTSSVQEIFAARDGNLVQTLFDLYPMRIPDPLARFSAVVDFLDKTGLPPFLTRPFAYYTQQPYTNRRVQGTLVWTGARNSVGVSAYRQRREALATGFALIDDFAFGRVVEGRGQALDWRLFLTPRATLNVTLNQTRNRAIDGIANALNRSAIVGLQMPVSGRTDVFATARHNRGEGFSVYRESALMTGLRTTF